ncbi:MAG: Na+/H+ antiporter NhaA [Hyphomicrobiales bacterium]|nr:Na+/H+ antiporter NhaA [Hyphomicrobiales bacterium]
MKPVNSEDSLRQSEVRAGLVLLLATAAALAVANSALAELYKSTLAFSLSLGGSEYGVEGPLKDWIKNALMAVFFLHVGLELKSEFKEGVLSNARSAALPFIAAAAGMAGPAAVYFTLTSGSPGLAHGWAIPTATDIAFAVGVIGLLGSRVPPGLKALLLAIAVIDDLGAIVVIALFYTAELNVMALALAGGSIVVMAAMNRAGVTNAAWYCLAGLLLWYFLSRSGVNPTLAGVTVAMFVPLGDERRSPLHDLAEAIKWPVTFLVMPIFAFANAGAPLSGLSLGIITQPLTSAVILGMVVGKPFGVTLAIWTAVRLRVSDLPEEVNWAQILGMGFIAGIGFTMSLFIGALAFTDEVLVEQARLGTLLGSLFAAMIGAALLVTFARRSPSQLVEKIKVIKRQIW